jgi:hypothetical protein
MTAIKSNGAAGKTNKPVPAQINGPAGAVKNDMTRAVFVVLGAVAAMVVLIFIYPFLTTLFGKQKEVVTSMEQLGHSHAKLEQKMNALTTQLQTMTENVSKRLDALEANQKTLEQELIGASVDAVRKEDQTSVLNRLDQLESRLMLRQRQISKIPETIGLFEKLRDQMQAAKPFDGELQAAQSLFDPQDQAMTQRLEMLKSYAAQGVPTMEQLQLEFKNVAKDLRRVSIPEDLPWYSKIAQRLRNLVVIRRQGEPLQGSSTLEDRLGGIQHLLELSNLDGALMEANLLPKLDSEVYNAWRVGAEKRLFIEQSLPILEAHALAYLLAGETPDASAETHTSDTGE